MLSAINAKTPVASFTKEVNPRLAKPLLVFNGRLANRWLTSLVKEATGDISPAYRIHFRLGLWQLRIKHNSFTIFTMIPNNSMKESSRVF